MRFNIEIKIEDDCSVANLIYAIGIASKDIANMLAIKGMSGSNAAYGQYHNNSPCKLIAHDFYRED